MLSASGPPDLQTGGDWEDDIKRCAIYTRKSSSETVERSLGTLDAQRQFCESYVASQAGDGWVALATRYDDGGFSGGSLARPAVTRLMEDVAAGLVDVVIVYKIDRLSRSLIDFSSLLGRFDARGVSFVSVTQAFNTAHSMGRLTLNVLLSFAQFERELASERLRDKFAASRARGLWSAGERPFGYRVVKGRLVVDEAEAGILRHIFRRYGQVGSARLLAQELTGMGHRNKRGAPFTKSSVRNYLGNRLYRGDLVHHGQAVPGTHEAIVSESVWMRARDAVAKVASRHRPSTRPMVPNPLKGRLFGSTGGSISQDFVYNRYGKLYRYYMPSGRRRYGADTDPDNRFRADTFDAAVIAAIEPLIPPASFDRSDGGQVGTLRRYVVRVDVGQAEMVIRLRTGEIARAAVAGRVRRSPLPPPKPAAI